MKRGKANSLMRGGNTYMEWASSEADRPRLEDGRSVGQLKSQASFSKKREWSRSEHDYFLVKGNDPVGESMRMTGGEAVTRNKRFEREFIAALDAKVPGARLFRWLVKRD